MSFSTKIFFLLSSLSLLQLSIQASTFKIPPNVTLCKRNDPNLNACLLALIRKQLPEIFKGQPENGVPALFPHHHGNVSVNTGPNGFIFDSPDLVVDVNPNMQIDSIGFDIAKKTASIEGTADATISGNFVSKGQFMSIPLDGKGDFKINAVGLHLKVDVEWELVTRKDNLEHIHLTKITTHYSLKDMKFEINDSVKGKDLTRMELLNESWRLVENAISADLIMLLNKTLAKTTNKILAVAPYNDILPM